MPNALWINLPMKDPVKSREFYRSLGFQMSPVPGDDEAFGLVIGNKKVMVMLFPEATFEGFAGAEVPDTADASQVLLSLGVDSREEVDELAAKARTAGGNVWGEPSDSGGWMYGAGFADPDGHRWNLLYMDQSRMPAK